MMLVMKKEQLFTLAWCIHGGLLQPQLHWLGEPNDEFANGHMCQRC